MNDDNAGMVVDYEDYRDMEKSRDKWRNTAIFFMSMLAGIAGAQILLVVL